MIKQGDQLEFNYSSLKDLYGPGPFEAISVSPDPWMTGRLVEIEVPDPYETREQGKYVTKRVYILEDYFVRVGMDKPEPTLLERILDRLRG